MQKCRSQIVVGFSGTVLTTGKILFDLNLCFVRRKSTFRNSVNHSMKMSMPEMTDTTQTLIGLSTLLDSLVTCSFEYGLE